MEGFVRSLTGQESSTSDLSCQNKLSAGSITFIHEEVLDVDPDDLELRYVDHGSVKMCLHFQKFLHLRTIFGKPGNHKLFI